VLIIREETLDDMAGVRTLNEVAFGQKTEAVLVDAIRYACPEAVSFIAVEEGVVLGHIMFSPTFVGDGDDAVKGVGLAPMSVLPERQGQGIGSNLVFAGIEDMRERGYPYIIALGHTSYYPRFGFEPAIKYGVTPQWEGIPSEAFMILVLDKKVMNGVSGTARYRKEFDQAV
jgi:putative acetyltransferase